MTYQPNLPLRLLGALIVGTVAALIMLAVLTAAHAAGVPGISSEYDFACGLVFGSAATQYLLRRP